MQTFLSDLDRRVIGNLSIPRNIENLTDELRRDAYLIDSAGEPLHATEEIVRAALDEMVGLGLAVNLGDGAAQAPGELAALVDRHGAALSMPDEKARIFETRMKDPRRAWRLRGDVYQLTQDGFDKLHEPTGPSPLPSLAQVQAMVDMHFGAIKDVPMHGSIHDADGGRLIEPKGVSLAKGTIHRGQQVATMLPEEFVHWAKIVDAAAKEAYGVGIRWPVGGGAGYGDADENLIIAAENGGTAWGVSTPWFTALTTVGVTDADTGSTITEPTGATGYARKSTASSDMGAASGGSSSNTSAIVFAGITGGTSQTVIGFAKCTASSAGRNVKYGTCASTTISTTQTPPQFGVGAHTTSVD